MNEYAFPTTTITTSTCFVCGKKGEVVVSVDAYNAWTSGDGPIQQFMPEMPAELREQLISGTHPACWDVVWGNNEGDNK